MSDTVRRLNSAGITAFSEYLKSARENGMITPPSHLLADPSFSEQIQEQVLIDTPASSDAYALGSYLVKALDPLDRRVIAYDHGLWSWLSLYYFDLLCPAKNGIRDVLEDAVYVLAEKYDHQRYYRHLLRTSWLAVKEHGEAAKVLLTTKGKRSEIFEQLASRQAIFGNATVIAGACKLYFDPVAGTPKRGSGSKGAGSPRRLVTFIQQIDLTYDLRDCTADQFLELLPGEFDKFKNPAKAVPAKKSPLKTLLSHVIPGVSTGTSAATAD